MKTNQTPSWILFPFYGSLVFGVLYSVFIHGFSDYNVSQDYHAMDGSLYIEPKLSLVPIRSREGEERGSQNFGQVCSACHGIYGSYKPGLVGPNLADKVWLHDNTEKLMARLVMKGVGISEAITKQLMPARGGANLSDREVWEVIYYLSSENSSIIKDSEPTQK